MRTGVKGVRRASDYFEPLERCVHSPLFKVGCRKLSRSVAQGSFEIKGEAAEEALKVSDIASEFDVLDI